MMKYLNEYMKTEKEKMVDYMERWTPEKDYSKYPKNKWCKYDFMANAIIKSGYKVKTSLENIITIIFLQVENAIENGCDIVDDSPEDIMLWVKENGGLQEFDYEC